MTAGQVHSFFKKYAQAFTDGDVDAICGLWDYPAFMSYDGRQAVLDAESFRVNTRSLMTFYKAQGVVRAEKEVLELTRLTETTASVRTSDTVFDQDGNVVAEWEHVYLLSDTPTGIKVSTALPDGELRAWRSRGTPLGG